MKISLKHTFRWSIMIAGVTLVLAAIFTIISSFILSGVSLAIGILVVFIIVLIGVFFDAIGLAAAAANEIPFHAMASEKVHGSREAILICRNADRFSSFCNDVIGDISGIVSGTASAIVVLRLVYGLGYVEDSYMHTMLAVLFTSVVAALTVGGKAVGKTFAIHLSTHIVLFVGKIFYHLDEKLHIKIFNGKSNNKKSKENGKAG
jgi:CBS domain containing-hemolysin-like protein